MASKIEQELLEICDLKEYKQGSDRQAFLLKLTNTVDKLDDDDWRRLSTAAQNWQNAATEAVDSKTEINDFADATPPEPEAEPEAQAEAESPPAAAKPSKTKESEVPRTATKAANGRERAPKPAAKDTSRRRVATAAAPTAKRERPESRGDSIPVLVRRMVIKNPSLTTKQVRETLEKKKDRDELPSDTVLNALRYNTVTVLKEAKALGHIKGLDI